MNNPEVIKNIKQLNRLLGMPLTPSITTTLMRVNTKLQKTIEVSVEIREGIIQLANILDIDKSQRGILEIWNDIYNKLSKQEVEIKGPELENTVEEKKKNHIINMSISSKVILKRLSKINKYRGRLLTIVTIPERYIYNGKWVNNGSPAINFYLSCRNCGFYNSSGASNDVNFKGIWFPFLGIDNDGWIRKSQFICDSKDFISSLENFFNLSVKKGDFLYYFLEKFSHWWQVSVSAAMPNIGDYYLWNIHPDLAKLKAIALNYDYDFIKSSFIPRDDIVKAYLLNINTDIENIIEPNIINSWLSENNALCRSE